jgi:DNA helicase-2/ATP-dependent DNA helicase PcrA
VKQIIKHSIDYLWKKRKFTPTDNQRSAILHTEGPLFLTAGPGSGKTRVLLWRTLNLIVYNSINPKEIFLSTFTEKAALQLKEGLKSLLAMVSNETGKAFDISKMSIGTVHSICTSILSDRRFTEGERTHPPVIKDELSQYFHLYKKSFWRELIEAAGFDNEELSQRTINQYLSGRDSGSRHIAVVNCISLFNRFSEECINPSSVKTTDTTLKKLLKAYKFYLDSLNSNHTKIADLSLLQQYAHNHITNFKNSGNVFKHIIIDEYQDTNSIQEKIFFELAKGHKNICIVGDDDQALYRFRGATVENLVEFPERCKNILKIKPKRIDLNINFRSKKKIVEYSQNFITKTDWKKENGKGEYRVSGKIIESFSNDRLNTVIVSQHDKSHVVYLEIAKFIKKLKTSKKIHDYNQVAFLFPSIRNNGGPSARVKGFMDAFNQLDIPYYAPRAGKFLNVEEAMAVFGLFLKIFGKPHLGKVSGGLLEFQLWMINSKKFAESLISKDKYLSKFIEDRQSEIATLLEDYEAFLNQIRRLKLKPEDDYIPEKMFKQFSETPGISTKAKKAVSSFYFNRIASERHKSGKPFTIKYIINRATALDWNILDLFYQLNGFKYFKDIYEKASLEKDPDEGPICNLGLITQYLSRFLDEYPPILTAPFLKEDKFINLFFLSYVYALYRLQESEYEDEKDPFPKGRVSFMTIHQAKGLEFPVVVLGSVFKTDRGPTKVEQIIRKLNVQNDGEPLDKISSFDISRMFYVALSRPQNLLVMPKYKGPSCASESFKNIFIENKFVEIKDFDFGHLQKSEIKNEDLGDTYSFTSDYLQYKKCPRQYMVFRKYGFVPSRSQTMFFGSLVHQTIEDLHNFLITQYKKND